MTIAMRLVNPGTARRGQFLKSFPLQEKREMTNFCRDTENAMKRNKITGEVVYTKVVAWGKKNQDTWQVFLLR